MSNWYVYLGHDVGATGRQRRNLGVDAEVDPALQSADYKVNFQNT